MFPSHHVSPTVSLLRLWSDVRRERERRPSSSVVSHSQVQSRRIISGLQWISIASPEASLTDTASPFLLFTFKLFHWCYPDFFRWHTAVEMVWTAAELQRTDSIPIWVVMWEWGGAEIREIRELRQKGFILQNSGQSVVLLSLLKPVEHRLCLRCYHIVSRLKEAADIQHQDVELFPHRNPSRTFGLGAG